MPQSLAKIYVHAIFSTKNREPLLHDDWRDELFRVIGGTANNLGYQSLIVGGIADHVHILTALKPTHRLSDVLCDIKKGTRPDGFERKWAVPHSTGRTATLRSRSVAPSVVRSIRMRVPPG